tara:strand:- start:232 stop:384 length:153 start_codon:yes stop_codon:yes gene_type:complete
MLIIEGMIPFIAPDLWRSLLLTLKDMDDNQIRMLGLALMISGTALLLIIN